MTFILIEFWKNTFFRARIVATYQLYTVSEKHDIKTKSHAPFSSSLTFDRFLGGVIRVLEVCCSTSSNSSKTCMSAGPLFKSTVLTDQADLVLKNEHSQFLPFVYTFTWVTVGINDKLETF